MADFSKQWCDLNDSDMPYDFDILEEFGKLPNNHYTSLICEGFGFIAIMRTDVDICLLAFYDDSVDEGVVWEEYDQFMNRIIK